MLSFILEYVVDILISRGNQMKNSIAALLMIAAVCAPGARAFAVPAQEPFVAPVGSVLAETNTSSQGLREKARRQQVLRDITRVTDSDPKKRAAWVSALEALEQK